MAPCWEPPPLLLLFRLFRLFLCFLLFLVPALSDEYLPRMLGLRWTSGSRRLRDRFESSRSWLRYMSPGREPPLFVWFLVPLLFDPYRRARILGLRWPVVCRRLRSRFERSRSLLF